MMVLKGRFAIIKLINNAAKGPKIGFGRAVIFLNQFGRKVTKNKAKFTNKILQKSSAFIFSWVINLRLFIIRPKIPQNFLIFISCFRFFP